MSFETKICEWVNTDNKIRKYYELIKSERAMRAQLTDYIISYAETNSMQHSVIQITDGKLKFQNTRITSPLSYKLIKECLNECLGNEETVSQIMQYIKNKREIHYNREVKRFYN